MGAKDNRKFDRIDSYTRKGRDGKLEVVRAHLRRVNCKPKK